MIFTVIWLPTALSKLIDIWVQAKNRQAITDATNAIDRTLRIDAHLKGQVFFGQRILACPPLVVTFGVSMNDRLVSVAEVRLLP